jgi:hypothetical protein
MRGSRNAVRGEVFVDMDGVERRLCLTFGALAEIEGILAERGEPGGEQVAWRVLAALLRGGGEDGAVEAVEVGRVQHRRAAQAISLAFAEALA